MMKSFLKYSALIAAAACITLLFASCKRMYITEDNNPTVALNTFCGFVSDGDYKAAFEFTGSAVDISPSDLKNSMEGVILSKIIQSVSITPLSEPEVSGRSAWQSVEMTHLDLRLAVRKMLAGVMEETSAYEWKHGSYKTRQEVADAVYESFRAQLDGDLSDCTVTETIKITYRYKNGVWTPVMTEPLYQALTGYASEAAESVDEFFAGYRSNNAAESQDAAGSSDPDSAEQSQYTESE